MKILKIIEGEICFDDDNKNCAMMLIIEELGVKQLHTENRGLNPITAMRQVINFLKNKKNIFTSCFEDQKKLITVTEKLGFKEISRQGNLIIYKRD